jgi:phosphoribosylanthranilate isomerase
MARTRVKICGITRVEDGLAAAAAGADAIGLVFYPRSSRWVEPAAAANIVAALPPFVTTVGLFLDAEAGFVREVMARVPLDLLQFHGAESPSYCNGFGRPYIKAVPMAETDDVAGYARRFGEARALLLDSHGGGRIGGTGERFDWERIPDTPGKPLILAGGLDPANVAEAIRRVRPYAVDVSSGVESARGIKDTVLIQAFMQTVTGTDPHA